ncbi:hypothetical protein NM688_g6229 [Phlebia brevispora]|uniref:Uncharacterized protein n=1 Tax=Phlebia brevispora TaxID=194682 RepID=A0ACC1SI92_9APHY|nr:hypothetical protein NM688_g6229 [Phlebia brevispora]
MEAFIARYFVPGFRALEAQILFRDSSALLNYIAPVSPSFKTVVQAHLIFLYAASNVSVLFHPRVVVWIGAVVKKWGAPVGTRHSVESHPVTECLQMKLQDAYMLDLVDVFCTVINPFRKRTPQVLDLLHLLSLSPVVPQSRKYLEKPPPASVMEKSEAIGFPDEEVIFAFLFLAIFMEFWRYLVSGSGLESLTRTLRTLAVSELPAGAQRESIHTSSKTSTPSSQTYRLITTAPSAERNARTAAGDAATVMPTSSGVLRDRTNVPVSRKALGKNRGPDKGDRRTTH